MGDTILLLEDEAIVKIHPTLSRQWSRKGERRLIPSYDNHEKRVVFGSVNPLTGECVTSFWGTINQVGFIEHLNELKNRFSGKNMIICLDNCRSHFTKKVQKFLEQNKNFFLLFLPPYSPDLNPIERLWQVMRKAVTNNTFFRSLDELESAIKDFFDSLAFEEVKLTCAI